MCSNWEQHEFATRLQEHAFAIHGELPIIRLVEENIEYGDTNEFLVDLENLSDTRDAPLLYYVGELLYAAIQGETYVRTTLKFSMTDTPYHLIAIAPETLEGRTILQMDVKIY